MNELENNQATGEQVQTLPVLPLKNTLLFPQLVLPLAVGRPSSVKAVEAVLATENKEVILVAQREPTVESPGQGDLYTIGSRAVVRKMNRQPDGSMELLVLGMERVVLLKLEQTEPFLTGRVREYPLPEDKGPEVEALHRSILELASRAIAIAQPQSNVDLDRFLAGSEDPLRLTFLLASLLSLDLKREQALLEAPTRAEALRLMHSYLAHEVQVLELRTKIANEARTEMTKEQRDYMLRQQMRAIQQELGEKNPETAEVDLLREKLEQTNLPEYVRKEAERELGRLERIPGQSPEHNISRTYLELVLELPWATQTEDNLDLQHARAVLDDDHFDLRDVKDRILEHLAVLKLNPGAKAPILCFVGPPGVGKTSMGQSIARSLGRKFERLSLGGLHDESELRGHRRTYIGAMPGRLVQAIRRAGANNPVLMLDEIDKLGRDHRGDPAAAMLEILDPEQNKTFRDNYLDMNFDLSKVLFVCTANTLDTIPRPLLDRMEILRLRGYSEEEKIQIARRYLIPRQIKEAGLTAEQVVITDELLSALISGYTREAGLRNLERAVGRVVRKVAVQFALGKTEPVTVQPDQLADMLGPQPFSQETMRKNNPAGVVTGLAWTETGGDVLYIEGTLLPEGRGMTLTGQLGDVMKESAQAAQSWLWSHAQDFGIDRELFKSSGVHIHVPAGAIPKDGPSAGVTMATALTSLYTKQPARSDVAMTGEITLTGLVLPIGGVKEKVLAARRAGIKKVILPKANEKDLRDLPENVRLELEFVFAERIEDVLAAAIPGVAERVMLAA